MATSTIHGVRIAGIASAVPSTVRLVSDMANVFGEEEVKKISQSTGVEKRHVAGGGLRCSDLMFAAAKKLLADLKWEPESVEALILVSQSCDFPLPATSCILQMRLGLSKSCAAFDVGLGCSGYVYGLWIASTLMAASGLSRVLLLSGDQSTCMSSPRDRATALLFGDAGTATALQRDDAAAPITFFLGTDGRGWNKLIFPSGLQFSRHPRDASTAERKQDKNDNWRSAEELYMDGAEIFAFTLREVSPMFASVLAAAGWNREDVDYFVLHQANKFMLTHLAKSMKLPLDKIPLSLQEYGNTSSGSIPLTINARLREPLASQTRRLLFAGFGVGYSWGACTLTCGPIVAPPVIEVDDSEAWQC